MYDFRFNHARATAPLSAVWVVGWPDVITHRVLMWIGYNRDDQSARVSVKVTNSSFHSAQMAKPTKSSAGAAELVEKPLRDSRRDRNCSAVSRRCCKEMRSVTALALNRQ